MHTMHDWADMYIITQHPDMPCSKCLHIADNDDGSGASISETQIHFACVVHKSRSCCTETVDMLTPVKFQEAGNVPVS